MFCHSHAGWHSDAARGHRLRRRRRLRHFRHRLPYPLRRLPEHRMQSYTPAVGASPSSPAAKLRRGGRRSDSARTAARMDEAASARRQGAGERSRRPCKTFWRPGRRRRLRPWCIARRSIHGSATAERIRGGSRPWLRHSDRAVAHGRRRQACASRGRGSLRCGTRRAIPSCS